MSEDTFRIVVTVAVLLASLAFVVQAGIVFAMYRLTRKIQVKTEGFVARAEPVLAKVEPLLDKAGPVIEKAGPVIEKVKDHRLQDEQGGHSEKSVMPPASLPPTIPLEAL